MDTPEVTTDGQQDFGKQLIQANEASVDGRIMDQLDVLAQDQDSKTMKRDAMTPIKVWAYTVGHFNNDLCACMWFIYLAYYLIDVVKVSDVTAAGAVLSGQLADGLSTPFIAIMMDYISSPCGKRTPWYIFGTLFVAPTFLGIFIYPSFVNEPLIDPETGLQVMKEEGGNLVPQVTTPNARKVWYILLPALFNLGWSAVQLSNMAIVNVITKSNRMCDRLANNRNGFTAVANILVLALGLALFQFVHTSAVVQFQILGCCCVGVGLCTSFFYMYQIREVTLIQEAETRESAYQIKRHTEMMQAQGRRTSQRHMGGQTGIPNLSAFEPSKGAGKKWYDWLKLQTFYIYGIVYMMVRLSVNVTLTVRPFYLIEITKFTGEPTPIELATVPLASYICQFIFSNYFQRRLTEYLQNRYLPMLVALCCLIGSSLPLAFLNEDPAVRWLVYPLACLHGVGLINMLNTSTALISDVIGNDADNAAFVYGCYSLFDKVANGSILFFVIEMYAVGHPEEIRWIMSLVPIAGSFFAFIFCWIGHTFYSSKVRTITGVSGR